MIDSPSLRRFRNVMSPIEASESLSIVNKPFASSKCSTKCSDVGIWPAVQLVANSAVAGLLAEGATVPFVARYRKEATGSLDEVAITAIRDGLARRTELEKRRTSILASLEERDLLVPELARRIAAREPLHVSFDPVLE